MLSAISEALYVQPRLIGFLPILICRSGGRRKHALNAVFVAPFYVLLVRHECLEGRLNFRQPRKGAAFIHSCSAGAAKRHYG